MTSPISKTSSVRPLEDWEREAWAAQNEAEEKERYARFQSFSFEEKLIALESRGREMAVLKEHWRAMREAVASKQAR